MEDTSRDLVDYDRFTQTSARRTTEKTGLALFMLAMTAFMVCVGSFALRQVEVGIGAAIVALLAAGAALAWLTTEGRRVRQVQRESGTGHRSPTS